MLATGWTMGLREMLRARARSLAVVLAASLVAVACSGGDDGGGAAGDPEAARTDVSVLDGASGSGLAIGRLVIDANPPSGSGCCLDVLAAGDIDGDGDGDVALGSQGADGAFWYSNPDWTRHPIAKGDFTTDGRLGDVDGDGRLDFVVSDYGADKIVWFQNPGSPDASWDRHEIGERFAHDVVLGDVDGDGLDDVITFRKDDPAGLRWYRHPADPAQPWPETMLADGLEGEGLAFGDTDGDGDGDIVASHILFTNDGTGAFAQTDLDPDRHPDVRPAIADVNGDGAVDIVLGPAERARGGVDLLAGPDWSRRPVLDDDLDGNHTLEIGDLDGDGEPDIVVGEMHTGGGRVIAYLNRGTTWDRRVLSTAGTHNARLVDLNGDGVLDVVGKNYDGPKVIEGWAMAASTEDTWAEAEIDTTRDIFEASGHPYLGLAFGDIDGDGFTDIASGRYVYRNPAVALPVSGWERSELPTDADAMWLVDLNGDGRDEVVAQALPSLLRFDRAADGTWSGSELATGIEPTEHTNSQGYATATIDGAQSLVYTAGDGIWYLPVLPNDGTGGAGPPVRITEGTSEDILAVGDIDGDGCTDAVGGVDGTELVWLANPCDGSPDWARSVVGKVDGEWADRAALADVNLDGRLDLVVSEENGADDGARTYWFEAPADPEAAWARHEIADQGSTNSMSVADLTGDGQPDVVTGEHRGERRLVVWENVDKGLAWSPTVVASGVESHLGARVVQLDTSGTVGIVNIGWDEPEYLRLWVRTG